MRTAYLIEIRTITGWFLKKEIYWDVDHAHETAELLLRNQSAMRVKIFRVNVPEYPLTDWPDTGSK